MYSYQYISQEGRWFNARVNVSSVFDTYYGLPSNCCTIIIVQTFLLPIDIQRPVSVLLL